MTNRKIDTKSVIAWMAVALVIALSIFSFPAVSARAQERSTETTGASRLADVEDGYDAGTSGICYEIEVPAF